MPPLKYRPFIAVAALAAAFVQPILNPSFAWGQEHQSANEPLSGFTLAPSPLAPSTTVFLFRESDQTEYRELPDVSGIAPNFLINDVSLHSFGDIYTIRGQSNVTIGDNAVNLVIDGVPQGDPFSLFVPLYDIDRVSIYRGAQPLLFGANSTAGVIDIETKQPGNEWHGSASASYSSFNTQDYRFSLSGPLVKNQLSFSIAGIKSTSDGYLYDPTRRERIDSRDTLAGRLSLTWTPAADWQISGGVESGTAHDGSDRAVSLYNFGKPISSKEVTSDFPGSLNLGEQREWLKIAKQFDTFQIKTVFGHSDWKLHPSENDRDLSPASASVAGTFPGAYFAPTGEVTDFHARQETWSAHLRIESLPEIPNISKDGKEAAKPASHFQWAAGLFFQDKDADAEFLDHYSQANFNEIYVPFESLYGFPVFGPEIVSTTYRPAVSGSSIRVREQDVAVYGNLTYTNGPFSIGSGIRVDYTRNRAAVTYGETSAPGLKDFDGKVNASGVEGASLQLSRDLTLFASLTADFKPGGDVTVRDEGGPFGYSRDVSYRSERDWNVETGVNWKTLESKLDLSLVCYYTWMSDYQFPQGILTEVELTPYTSSSAEARGVEFAGALTLAKGLVLSGNVGYNETVIFGDGFHGTQAPLAPEFTALTALDYIAPCGFCARVDFLGIGRTIYGFQDRGSLHQDPYGLLNARIGFKKLNYGAYLFARNLCDTKYYTALETGRIAGYRGEPRVLGVMAELMF